MHGSRTDRGHVLASEAPGPREGGARGGPTEESQSASEGGHPDARSLPTTRAEDKAFHQRTELGESATCQWYNERQKEGHTGDAPVRLSHVLMKTSWQDGWLGLSAALFSHISLNAKATEPFVQNSTEK